MHFVHLFLNGVPLISVSHLVVKSKNRCLPPFTACALSFLCHLLVLCITIVSNACFTYASFLRLSLREERLFSTRRVKRSERRNSVAIINEEHLVFSCFDNIVVSSFPIKPYKSNPAPRSNVRTSTPSFWSAHRSIAVCCTFQSPLSTVLWSRNKREIFWCVQHQRREMQYRRFTIDLNYNCVFTRLGK